MNDVANKARAGADFIDLAGMYSDTRDSGAYFKHGEISPGLEGEVFAGKPGDIVGPCRPSSPPSTSSSRT
jgi:hypothetical protein